MRILLSCLQDLRPHPISPYKFWEFYLKRGIEEAGHSWIEVPGVDWAEGLASTDNTELARWRDRTWTRVLEFLDTELRKSPIDFFLSYLYPQTVDRSAIRDIQKLGIPCVNFFCDNVREFRRVPKEFDCFDLHWVPEYQALAMYREAGLKCLHAPMPCWISPEHRTSDHSESSTVSFIGSSDELRWHLLGTAIQLGADISIFGSGWENARTAPGPGGKIGSRLCANQINHIRRHGVKSLLMKFGRRFFPPDPPPPIPKERLLGRLSPSDYVRVMQQSCVAIGINRVEGPHHSRRSPATYSRLRDLEAPMMGACYLTEWAEDLVHLYDLGVEIESYRTPLELVARIDELRSDATRRLRLRENGQQRALAELSVPATLGKIARELNLPG